MAFEPRLGPCHIFKGDPTTADGADMQYLGKTRGDVIFNPQLGINMGRADQVGRTPLADTVYDSGPLPILQAPFVDEEVAKMLKYFENASQVTNSTRSAMGFSDGISKIAIANIETLAVIPVAEIGEGTNGIDAPNAIWLPRCIAVSPGEFTFNLPDGDDILNPHTVEFHALYYETDQDDNTINAALRYGFIGAPGADSGLSWSLPAVAD